MAYCKSVSRAIVAVILTVGALGGSAEAQLIRAPLDSGFVRTSSIVMSVDEMLGFQKARVAGEPILGPGFPGLWIAEVQFKPVRYRRMDVIDPKTKQKKTELVWYMIYRVIPRDYTELAGDGRDDLITKLSDPDIIPQNSVDPLNRFPVLIPRFILRTDDAGAQQEYTDEVNIQIQRNILTREIRNRTANVRLLNSVQAIVEIDPALSDGGQDGNSVGLVSVDDPDQLGKALYGVAVWRNVDPRTDYFTVTMTGFSNAYRISTNAAGETVVEHKVIEQKFGRPGDEFNQHEKEFRLIDEAKMLPSGDIIVNTESSNTVYRVGRPAPEFVSRLRTQFEAKVAAGEEPEQKWPNWQYQERKNVQITVPEYDQILRNAKNTTVPAQ